jgi:ATP-dependent Clp protease ATP-binding subunit ClpC
MTERARQVVILAQDEARGFQHDYIGTEHLLLGLIREEEGLAARSLEEFNLTIDKVRSEINRTEGRGNDISTTGQLPFTPRAKKVLELALREALSLGHNYIGTEHILLAFAREGQGVGYRILERAGISSENIRDSVIRLLSGPRKEKSPKLTEVKTDAAPLYRLVPQILLAQIQQEVQQRHFGDALTLATAYKEIVLANKS